MAPIDTQVSVTTQSAPATASAGSLATLTRPPSLRAHSMTEGGGCSEAAVVSMNGIVSAHTVRTGGMKLDEAIISYVRKKYGLVIGDPTERDVYLGPVISDAAARKFEEASSSARKAGALLAGGTRPSGGPLDKGYYVAPTIAKLPLDHELYQRELFLPFLAVGVVKSFDHALEEANRSKLGLTGGLFSNDDREIDRFFNEMEAGVLYVNRRTGATTGAWPGVQSFCGWKGSGITGKGGCGPYYVAQFLREQSRTRMV